MTAPLWPEIQPTKSRLLVALILDTSQSMRHTGGIDELNTALRAWREELRHDANLRRIGEIAMVTFGYRGVRTVDPRGGPLEPDDDPFVPVEQFNPPTLRADGFSPMVKAIKRTTTIVDLRRRALETTGVQMAYRPLIYLLTDGAPTDEDGNACTVWPDLARELRRQEEQRILRFFAFGVGSADLDVLRALAPEDHLRVTGTDFAEALGRVRRSVERAARTGQPAVRDTTSHDDMHDWFVAQSK